jgi:plastocyanin
MKKLLIFFVVIIATIFAIIILNFEKNSEVVDMTDQDEISIVLTDNGYEPREVRIDKGTKITFSTTRNNKHWPASNLHPTHEIYSELDSKRPLEVSEQWSFIFNKKGVWGFHDHIRSYFTGVIYVSD